MNKATIAVLMASLYLSGCSALSTKSTGEEASGYTYVPLDPFAVRIVRGAECPASPPSNADSKEKKKSVLRALPDNAVRMSISTKSASGTLTYGASSTKASSTRYKVTLDYINADTTNFTLLLRKRVRLKVAPDASRIQQMGDANGSVVFGGGVPDAYNQNILPNEKLDPMHHVEGSERFDVVKVPDDIPASQGTREGFIKRYSADGYLLYTIPVYVGVGLRVTADVSEINGTANLTGLSVIGMEAEAKNIRGSLVVQTLGVNGKSISAALPINNDLNLTTTQNAVSAIGAIKALLYEDETEVKVRVVGLYLPFPGGEALVNAIISEMAQEPITWKTCSI